MGLKLLFVCTGNTCRSPLAEGLAKSIFGKAAEISSAGMEAWEGEMASSHSIQIAAELGIDLSSHRSRRIEPDLLAAADWIIPMTKVQEERLKMLYPEFQTKIRRLGVWTDAGADIQDPWGGSLEVYRKSAIQIKKMLEAMKNQL